MVDRVSVCRQASDVIVYRDSTVSCVNTRPVAVRGDNAYTVYVWTGALMDLNASKWNFCYNTMS